MAYILNIDTSSKNCSVALQEDDALISHFDIHIEKSASSLINLYVDRILQDAGLLKSNLSAIAVGVGPGSYTGLRIAVSTAKGLALGLDIPLIAVNTLEAMAYSQLHLAHALNAYVCPMIDARRMEVYTCLLDAQLQVISPTEAMILDETSFTDVLSKSKIVFLGDGSNKLKEVLVHPNATFIPNVLPSARFMAQTSYEKYKSSRFEDTAYLEPFYLKDFMSTSKNSSSKTSV